MKIDYRKMLFLLVCAMSSLSLHAQNYSKNDLLSFAIECFEKGEYQEARLYIKKYASFDLNDGDKKLVMELSSKCKSCEECQNKANTAFIEGDHSTAELFYIKLKALNPNHPNIQQLIDKCRKQTTENALVDQSVTPPSQRKQIFHSLGSNLENFKSLLLDKDNDYCRSGKNEYIAWCWAGTGYPLNFVNSIEYRTGSIIGFGLYCDIGVDLTKVTVKNTFFSDNHYDDFIMKKFRFVGGVKFYLHKGMFLDCGYGSIVPATADVEYSYYGNLGDDEKTAISKMVSTGHGWLFHIGYNYSSKPYFVGFSGGFSYDVVNKKTAPSINLKIGVAWGL